MSQKNVLCSLCDRKFKTEESLGHHMEHGHIRRTIGCNMCDRKFKKNLDVSQHYHDRHHSTTCPKCGECFGNKHLVIEHMVDEHILEISRVEKIKL